MTDYERIIELAWREEILFYLACVSPFMTIAIFFGGYWVAQRIEWRKRTFELDSQRSYCLKALAEIEKDIKNYLKSIEIEADNLLSISKGEMDLTLNRELRQVPVVNIQLFDAIPINVWKDCLESDKNELVYRPIRIARAIMVMRKNLESAESAHNVFISKFKEVSQNLVESEKLMTHEITRKRDLPKGEEKTILIEGLLDILVAEDLSKIGKENVDNLSQKELIFRQMKSRILSFSKETGQFHELLPLLQSLEDNIKYIRGIRQGVWYLHEKYSAIAVVIKIGILPDFKKVVV